MNAFLIHFYRMNFVACMANAYNNRKDETACFGWMVVGCAFLAKAIQTAKEE